MSKPWVLYTRVSTEKQAQRGASLEAQLAACEALAKAHDYTTIHIADEGESAAEVAQKGLARIRAMAARGEIAGVLVYKLDRVARHTRGLLELLEDFGRHGVQFTSVREHIDTSGAAGRLIVTVLAALAQFEREQLSERVKATNDHRRSQGAWIAGSAPIGCTTVLRGKMRFLVAHPQWGTAVGQAWTLILQGRSLAKVAAVLQAAGVPTATARRKTKGVWSRNAVSAVVANRSYVGVLVTEDDFERVRIVLGSKVSPRTRAAGLARPGGSDRFWRLPGLAVCARCGSALIGYTATGRGAQYPYLRCTGRMHRGRAFCPAKDMPAQVWEDRVVEVVAGYLSDRASVIEAINQAVTRRRTEAGPARDKLAGLQATRDDIQSRLDRALNLALEGGTVARAVSSRIAILQSQLEAVTPQVAAAEGLLAAVELPVGSLEATAALLGATADDLPSRSPEDQRAVLVALRTQARIARGMPCTVTISIPYLGDGADPGSFKTKGNLPNPDGRRTMMDPLAVVEVPLADVPMPPRRWYRRPPDP